jgi:hypothetical protein
MAGDGRNARDCYLGDSDSGLRLSVDVQHKPSNYYFHSRRRAELPS